jgi:hypothetical protein
VGKSRFEGHPVFEAGKLQGGTEILNLALQDMQDERFRARIEILDIIEEDVMGSKICQPDKLRMVKILKTLRNDVERIKNDCENIAKEDK